MKYPKLRRNVEQSVRNLLHYVNSHETWYDAYQREFDFMLSHVLEDLGTDQETFVDVMQETPYWGVIFGYTFEAFAIRPSEETGRTLIDDYLRRHGRHETLSGRQYLHAIKDSQVRFWEVTEVAPAEYVDIRPYGTQQNTIRVAEYYASQNLCRWDCIAARLINLNQIYLFSGAVLPIPLEKAMMFYKDPAYVTQNMKKAMLAACRDGVIEQLPDNFEQAVREKVDEVIPLMAFRTWVLNRYNACTRMPDEPENADGEVYRQARVRFPLRAEREQIAQALNQAELLTQVASSDGWTWCLPDAPDMLLGTVKLREKALELRVESRERAEQGRQMLADLLGAQVGSGMILYATDQPVGKKNRSGIPTNVIQTQAEQPDLSQFKVHMDQECRSMLNDSLSVLDARTPRDCAANPDSHEDVVDWLKFLENRSMHASLPPYDFTWMWEELGLMQYR
ncbi:MAG: hypothetical protein AAF669_03060 [Pseudomonadota bacterium]